MFAFLRRTLLFLLSLVALLAGLAYLFDSG
jgi:hypothetical protein